MTTSEAALPTPLIDVGAVRRLGAEVIEFPVLEGHAIVGRRVRETGLPRDALLNVIIRGEQALLPRGSTEIAAGDRLHLLVRQEAAVELRPLLERWQTGPMGQPARERPATRASPRPVLGASLEPGGRGRRRSGVDRGRRRPRPAAHAARRRSPARSSLLEDGSYAFTGPVVGIGNRTSVLDGARRQLRLAADDAERTWWRNVIGALAAP